MHNDNHQKGILKPGYMATVSIVICTFNRATHLERSINSVLQQSVKEWELIIVDDGSNDHTFELVNKYVAQYPNVKYAKHSNQGQALARNTGIMLTTGEYITFLDSDDAYKPKHLQTRLDFMYAHRLVDMIHGGVEFNEDIFVSDYYNSDKLINLKECVLCGSIFGKKQVFLELNGFNNQRYGEDIDLWERASVKFNTQWIKEPETYIYTRAEHSVSKEYTMHLLNKPGQ